MPMNVYDVTDHMLTHETKT